LSADQYKAKVSMLRQLLAHSGP